MSAEREIIERRFGGTYGAWAKAVVEGSSLARRILLWVLLKRTHPTVKYDDVDFAWDELRVEHSRQELGEIRDKLSERFSGQDLLDAQAFIDADIAAAIDDDEFAGKVQPPIVG
ncbi:MULTISPECIES: hypothetical protein [unclassified Frankia]|uniref:hypothetical protein n=1 Tax=unclassified Frankia TaxID=2632575 RepID=UPI001931EE95|nr:MULTISPECIES: hypothetical protein [unclassified Frankia]MBL7624680.1 hypothetical protein [Frankia sp. AgB1.8]